MIVKRPMYYPPRGEERMLHIHLPDGYDLTDERYPVMYFFDGHNLFRDEDATYGKCWGLEAYLNLWQKPMIIVGMECSHRGNERLDEYSPYTFSNRFFGDVQGLGVQTLDWIVSEIKPMIDREYRTWPFREATGLGGSSMGGLMSLYGAVRYNCWFSKAACLSSAVAMCTPQLRRDILESTLDPDTRVYLSWGTAETDSPRFAALHARRNRELAELLEQRSIQTRLYCQEDGRHCEADWERQIPAFMPFLWF